MAGSIDRINLKDANGAIGGTELQGLDGAAYVIVRGGLTSERPNLGTGHASVVFAMDDYETVAANTSTPQVLGAVGAGGDYLHQLICVVTNAAAAAVVIKDGGAGSDITVLPASVGAVGTYAIPMGLISTSNGWRVTTGTGVSVIASGVFT